jgi:hypothetical protein
MKGADDRDGSLRWLCAGLLPALRTGTTSNRTVEFEDATLLSEAHSSTPDALTLDSLGFALLVTVTTLAAF